LDPKEIGVAVRWLELNPPAEPIWFERVKVLAKRGAPIGNKNAAKDKEENKPLCFFRRDDRHLHTRPFAPG
jgi:hypothetical protein